MEEQNFLQLKYGQTTFPTNLLSKLEHSTQTNWQRVKRPRTLYCKARLNIPTVGYTLRTFPHLWDDLSQIRGNL